MHQALSGEKGGGWKSRKGKWHSRMQISFSRIEGQGRMSRAGWCGIRICAGTGWRLSGRDGCGVGGDVCSANGLKISGTMSRREAIDIKARMVAIMGTSMFTSGVSGKVKGEGWESGPAKVLEDAGVLVIGNGLVVRLSGIMDTERDVCWFWIS